MQKNQQAAAEFVCSNSACSSSASSSSINEKQPPEMKAREVPDAERKSFLRSRRQSSAA